MLGGRELTKCRQPTMADSNKNDFYLTPESRAFLAMAHPPACPLQRDIPVKQGRAKMEAALRQHGGPYLPLRRIEDISLPCLDGQGHFPIRVYWPRLPEEEEEGNGGGGVPSLPVLLYAHGGGWVKGSASTHDQLCRRLALLSGHVVVAVDYRLSPEARFPQALEDLEAAFEWVQTQPGMDPTRLSVAGDSAGGNLVAGLVVRLLGRGGEDARKPERPVKKQALIYPVLDLTSSSGDSYKKYGEGFGLSNASIAYYVESYLGPDEQAQRARHPEASPLFVAEEQVGSLPATLLVSARADPLLSDAEAYRAKLEAKGVPVRHKIYEGLVHAYAMFFDVFPEAAEGTVQDVVDFLKEEL